jgi:hypothetical protein
VSKSVDDTDSSPPTVVLPLFVRVKPMAPVVSASDRKVPDVELRVYESHSAVCSLGCLDTVVLGTFHLDAALSPFYQACKPASFDKKPSHVRSRIRHGLPLRKPSKHPGIQSNRHIPYRPVFLVPM